MARDISIPCRVFAAQSPAQPARNAHIETALLTKSKTQRIKLNFKRVCA
jgi:hypothetical protein